MPPNLTFTIRGHQFTVPRRFQAGHRLTEAEAWALDRAIVESLRNRLTVLVDDLTTLAGGESPDLTEVEAEVRHRFASYQFPSEPSAPKAPSSLDHEIQTLAFEAAAQAYGLDHPDLDRHALLFCCDPAITHRAKSRLAQRAMLAAHAVEDLMP